MKDNIPSGLKSKQEIYFEATHKQMGNADGTRMDIIFEAMQMYADQFQPPSSTSVKVEELAKDSASLHLKKVGTHDRPDITEHDFIEGFKAGFLAASDELNLLTETIKNQHELILSGEKRGYEKAKEEFAASPKGKEEENCNHEPLTDTGVGYYHCPACGKGWTYDEWKKLSGSQPSGMQWQLCPKCNGDGSLPIANVEYATGIADFTCDLCNGKKVIEPPSNTADEDAVEFAEWLGEQVLEYDKGNWFTPNMEKSSINNSYRVTYENPVTTKQLYNLFKQSKEKE